MIRRTEELVIIGGGPAGLAAALGAWQKGCRRVLLLERDRDLGGILNQCIHNGFGLHTFKEELTGPEYAERYVQMVKQEGIPCLLQTIVTDIALLADGRKRVTAMNRSQGLLEIITDGVILAMGCRERPRGALNIPGYRPAGIYSAGTAQYYVNIEGRLPAERWSFGFRGYWADYGQKNGAGGGKGALCGGAALQKRRAEAKHCAVS